MGLDHGVSRFEWRYRVRRRLLLHLDVFAIFRRGRRCMNHPGYNKVELVLRPIGGS